MTIISIIGAGAWGSALALAAHRGGNQVRLYSPLDGEVKTLNDTRTNAVGATIPEGILISSDLAQVTKDCDVVVLAPPAQKMGSACEALRPFTKDSIPLIITSKGIENITHRLMSEVVGSIFPQNPLAVLSGPSFATEVSKGLPTAVTMASSDMTLAAHLCEIYSSSHFRPYASTDIIGAQAGGALKNVIAIACGVLEGMQLGDNARAGIVTRGLAEMTRLGVALGAKSETFMGLSGLGDLTLTALSHQSRNMSFGYALGQGKTVDELKASGPLTEGVYTVESAMALAARYKVDMPITNAVDALINHGCAVKDLIKDLLSRPLTTEAA